MNIVVRPEKKKKMFIIRLEFVICRSSLYQPFAFFSGLNYFKTTTNKQTNKQTNLTHTLKGCDVRTLFFWLEIVQITNSSMNEKKKESS
jgi:hypothetical protein